MSTVDPPVLTLGYTSAIGAAAQTVFAFDGNASITGSDVTFPISGATVTLWINAASAANGVILGYAQQPSTNPGRFWIKNPSNLSVGIGTTAIATTNLSCADGAWHHLAVTVAPQNTQTVAIAIYIDGICAWSALGALSNVSGLAISATGDLVLGQGISPEPNLTASMSQFVLWNSVLTDAAILSLMQTRPPSSSTTVIDWQLTSTQTSGTVVGGAFVTSNPALRFRSDRTLTATWVPPAITGATFDLAVTSSDCVYHPLQTGINASPTTVPSPQAGVTYSARIRAVSGQTAGAWSTPATAVALDLGQAAPVLPTANTTPFLLAWPAIDQAVQYTMSFLQDGTTSVPPSGTQAGTSVDVTSLVQNASHTYIYTVYGTGGGSTGPLSATAAMPSAPVLAMAYGPDGSGGSTLVATWPLTDNATTRYLSVARVNGGTTSVTTAILPGTTASYTVPVAVLEGQVYSATLRGLTTGTIGPWSNTAQVTIHIFGVPVFGTVTSDYNLHTITVPWTFTPPAGVTALFDLQLWNADKTTMITEVNPATSPQPITNSAIVVGVTLNLRIRAYADGSTGAWSNWLAVVPNGVPQVVGLSANVDAYGKITANWDSVLTQNPGLQGVTYVATLYKAGAVFYTAPEQSGTSIALPQSTTGVTENTTYELKVYAKATGLSPGPPSAPVSLTVGTIKPYPPPPPNNVSDPVGAGTGAFNYMNEDLVVNGVVPLVFTTFYNSDRPLPSDNPLYSNLPLGNRWNHSYNTALKIDQAGGFVYIMWGSGGVERFSIPQQSGAPYANAGAKIGSTLTKAGDGTYTLVQPGVKTYSFDSSGRLTAIVEPNGNQATLAYAGQQLTTITDIQSNHRLTLTYTGNWLQTVSDGTRTVSYVVTNANLMSTTNPLNKTRSFTYAASGTSMIETVVDFSQVTALKNTYQNQKVSLQQDARALANHQSYGTQFAWSTGTYAMTQTVVADITDREGNASHYESLSGNGALVLERYQLDPNNILVRTHSYDGYANILSTVEYQGAASAYQTGLGNATAYTYAPCGKPATTITQLSSTLIKAVSNSYDGNGNLLTSAVYEGPAAGYQPGQGNVTTRHYNPDNTPQWIQPPLGAKTQFTYWSGDTHGLVETMTDTLGNVFSMTWDANGLPQTVTDPYGAVTTYSWNSAGFLLSQTVQASDGSTTLSTSYTPNGLGQVSTAKLRYPGAGQSDAQSFVTTVGYNDNNNRQLLTDPTSATVTYGYDQNNNLTSLTWSQFQGTARTLQWGYDRDDFLSSTVWSASNPTVSAAYINNQLGRRVQLTDPRNAVYTYGLAMTPAPSGPLPLVATTQWPSPGGGAPAPLTAATYDPLRRLTHYVDRAGIATDIAYAIQTDVGTNTQQTVVTVTRPPPSQGGQPTVTRETYNALGRPVQFVDEAGKTWTWAYTIETDPTTQKFVQVVTRTDPTNRTLAMATDSFNRIAFLREAGSGLTRLTQYAYDAIGRLAGVTVTQGSDTNTTTYSYGYDATSNCSTMTVGRPGGGGGATVLYYNGRGDLMRQVNPFGQPSAFAYAPWGALGSFVNGRSNSFTYGFDPAGRLKTITQPDATQVVQTLDANGNRLTTQIGAGPGIARTFDTWNRMLTRTDVNGRQVGYAYWPESEIKQLTYPDGKNVNYVLDGLGRLSTATDWNGRSATYGWSLTNLVGSIAFKTAAGATYATASYNYDDAGRATGYLHQAGNLILTQASYVLDGLGQPSTAPALILPMPPTLPNAPQTLTYTTGNEIDTIDGVAQDFDADGDYLGPNGSQPIASYDVYGRVVGYGADTYGYDLDGLRTSATVGGTASTDVYDIAKWQSPQVERADPVRAVTDAALLPTAYNGRSPLPVYAGAPSPAPLDVALDRLIASYGADGQVTARYVHGTGLLGAEDATGAFAAALGDSMGNVVVRVNEAGQIVDRAVYGPYGDLYGRTANASSPFLFNGRDGVQSDGNGLLYMRARSYAPAQFRFLQPDFLLGDRMRPQSLNRYAFALGDPLQMNDPTGLAVLGVVIGLGALAVLGLIGLAVYCVATAGGGAGAGVVGGGSVIELEPLLDEGSGSDVEDIEMDDVSDNTEPYEPPEVVLRTSTKTRPSWWPEGLRQRNVPKKTGMPSANNPFEDF